MSNLFSNLGENTRKLVMINYVMKSIIFKRLKQQFEEFWEPKKLQKGAGPRHPLFRQFWVA